METEESRPKKLKAYTHGHLMICTIVYLRFTRRLQCSKCKSVKTKQWRLLQRKVKNKKGLDTIKNYANEENEENQVIAFWNQEGIRRRILENPIVMEPGEKD